jgi:hypothetical protein
MQTLLPQRPQRNTEENQNLTAKAAKEDQNQRFTAEVADGAEEMRREGLI